MVKPGCSNVRVITANFLDVQIFRIFMVFWMTCAKSALSLSVSSIFTLVVHHYSCSQSLELFWKLSFFT